MASLMAAVHGPEGSSGKGGRQIDKQSETFSKKVVFWTHFSFIWIVLNSYFYRFKYWIAFACHYLT